jgi:hypothetical protein
VTRKSITTAMTLYRAGTATLEQAAQCGGIPAVTLAAALESHGIPVHESRSDPD